MDYALIWYALVGGGTMFLLGLVTAIIENDDEED